MAAGPLAKRGAERVNCQVGGVRRGLRQAAHGAHDISALELERLIHTHAARQFGKRGTAGNGGHAAFGAKANLGDAAGIKLQCQFQNIAAGGVFHARGSIGAGNVARIARVLKMIENFCGIHTA